MGVTGADVALDIADVALMADDLTQLPYVVTLARRSRRIIAQNIGLSVAVILLLVVAAITGKFSLIQGVLVDETWALVIIGNRLRLLADVPGGSESPPACALRPPACIPRHREKRCPGRAVTPGCRCPESWGTNTFRGRRAQVAASLT